MFSAGGHAFSFCVGLTTITYKGTIEQWERIQCESTWLLEREKVKKIICKDGTINL